MVLFLIHHKVVWVTRFHRAGEHVSPRLTEEMTNLSNAVCCREAADKVVTGSGKFEELVVCSQEIAASTTQLVVSSKVKAPRGSKNLPLLANASRDVTAATGKVVASAKSAAQMIEDLGMFLPS